MTRHVAGRLYALSLALVVFFLTWAVVAARPWSSSATPRDPRLDALARREVKLRRRAVAVHAVVTRRWAAYHRALAARRAEIAAVRALPAPAPVAPSAAVRVVTLPPLTITRTS
ncbi:MAG TPA: hypothetical protein VFL60_10765 [Gaiellaceae bacterium]|nr:hypothetical protein [Gaiellaceae bacterium]